MRLTIIVETTDTMNSDMGTVSKVNVNIYSSGGGGLGTPLISVEKEGPVDEVVNHAIGQLAWNLSRGEGGK